MTLLALFACSRSPVVTLLSPEDGDAVRAGEPLTLVARISDDDPIEDIRYTLLAEPGDALDVAASFDGDVVTLVHTRALLPGPVTLTLTATDPGGGAGRATVDLTVSENQAPRITLGTDTSRVGAGVPLAVLVTATDPDEADPSVLLLTWEGAEGPDHPDAAGAAVGEATFWTVGAARVSVTVIDPSGAVGFAELALEVFDADDDGDGWPGVEDGGEDCDDTDPSVNPDAVETCDGVDQDCDGVVDDGPEDGAWWYPDADRDGYGAEPGEARCAQPDGWIAIGGDCDDTSEDVSPAAVETCDDVDEDCDGVVDDDPIDGFSAYADADGDGYGDDASVMMVCELGSGAVALGGDCDDTSADVSPAATERCDAADVDEDCDGLADDADTSPSGRSTWYRDADGDGYGASGTTRTACDAPAGYVADATDCNDAAASAYPGGVEVCEDGLDGDCDGTEPACTLAGTVDLAAADGEWAGVSANDFAGPAAAVGDQDGDGLPDLVVGTWGRSSLAGAVYIAPGDGGGALSAAYASRSGVSASDSAGYAVAGVGDLDGDGWDDVLVGAYGTDGGGTNSGGAYVLLGPVTGTGSLSSADGLLVGESAGDVAGWSVGAAGDTDGDGRPELLVGATGQDGGGSGSGRVYLYEGAPSGTVDLSAATARLTGEDASDAAGYSVAGAGDTNGDGLDDVLVGGPGASTGPGTVWLLEGPVSGNIDLSAADATRTGGATGDAAGTAVAGAGDTDGDGYDDVIVGAPQADGGGTEAGAAYLLLGPVTNGSLAAADAVFLGDSAQDRAGTAVAGGGDADGDGRADVLVGAYYDATGGTGAGATYLLYGALSGSMSLGTADAVFLGETARDAAGKHVGFAGDVDGDGFDDLWIGATGAGSGAGAVYILFGGGG